MNIMIISYTFVIIETVSVITIYFSDQSRGTEMRHYGLFYVDCSETRQPFGRFERSGNGREYGAFGLDDFLETKTVIGHDL